MAVNITISGITAIGALHNVSSSQQVSLKTKLFCFRHFLMIFEN
jgi:hypothetical protein